MRTRLFSLCVLMAVALPAGLAEPRSADNSTSNYVYCVLIDNVRSTLYFSNVFPGYPGRNTIYLDAFHEYVHTIAPRVYGSPQCSYSDSLLSARHSKETRESHLRGAYRSLVETGWSL